MKEYSYEAVFEIVKKEIPIKKSNSVFGITFVAGQGTGKSYVANIISQKTGLYVTSNDRIRRIYDELGFSNYDYEEDIKRMANDRTIYLLENRVSHIIDANMEFFWEMAEKNFKKYGAKLYFVELICDEDEIIKRITKRANSFHNTDNYSRATVDDYYAYLERKKKNAFPKEKIFFSIDVNVSGEKLEKQIDELLKKVGEDNE